MPRKTYTATFSNGHTHKGTSVRPVHAAWMMVEKATGRVLACGFSLDRKRAAATARNNVHWVLPYQDGDNMVTIRRGPQTAEVISYYAQKARELGWDGKGSALDWLRALSARVSADRRARVTIEVVDL